MRNPCETMEISFNRNSRGGIKRISAFYFIVTASTCSCPPGKIENAIIGHSPWLRRRSGGTSCCYSVTTESRTALHLHSRNVL